MSRTFRHRHSVYDIGWLYCNGTPWRTDYKPYWKPSKWFKKIRMKHYRAQVKQAFIRGREFPVDKKVDIWNWN